MFLEVQLVLGVLVVHQHLVVHPALGALSVLLVLEHHLRQVLRVVLEDQVVPGRLVLQALLVSAVRSVLVFRALQVDLVVQVHLVVLGVLVDQDYLGLRQYLAFQVFQRLRDLLVLLEVLGVQAVL